MHSHSNDLSSRKYCLTSIEKSDPPADMPSGNYCQYVVMYGDSAINCVRAGTLKEVTLHAEDFVKNLNSRSTMSYSNYAPRNNKNKTA